MSLSVRVPGRIGGGLYRQGVDSVNRDCPFCKIASGREKADIVYSDADVMVIRDVHPRAPVHLLVMPRRHVESADDVEDPSIWSAVMDAATRVAREV